VKNIILFFGLFLTISCSAQIDSILIETLTEQEYSYLNLNLNRDKYDFDFKDKKVAFFNSPGGTVIRSKSYFFEIENDTVRGSGPFDIVVFADSQKAKHGYDVAVIYGSKNFQPKISNKLKRMVRKQKRN